MTASKRRVFSGDGGENFDRAGVNLVAVCHGNGLRVGGELIQPAITADVALLARPAGPEGCPVTKAPAAGRDFRRLGLMPMMEASTISPPRQEGIRLAGIDITDCVSESGKIPSQGHRSWFPRRGGCPAPTVPGGSRGQRGRQEQG